MRTSLFTCHRLPSFRLALVGLLSTVAFVALAQSDADTLATLRVCRQIEQNNARLACFDGALPLPLPAARAPTVTPAEPQTVAAPQPRPEPQRESATRRSVETDARAGNDRDADNERAVVIVEVRQVGNRSTTFVTDTGEVWVQTSGNRARYPEVPFETVLQAGSFGSTFLVSPRGGPRVRVSLRD